jgi:hypothetical protein
LEINPIDNEKNKINIVKRGEILTPPSFLHVQPVSEFKYKNIVRMNVQ